MCSTPRPKSVVKGKTKPGGSFLSNTPAETRSRFAKRANSAQVRRQNIEHEKQQNRQIKAVAQRKINPIENKNYSLGYWLVSASLKEIFTWVFLGKSKRI